MLGLGGRGSRRNFSRVVNVKPEGLVRAVQVQVQVQVQVAARRLVVVPPVRQVVQPVRQALLPVRQPLE